MKSVKIGRFSQLIFPIHEVTGDVLKAVPELARIKQFQSFESDDRDKLFKYICYMYDRNSELIREYKDLQARKEAALHEAGFAREKNGEYPPEVKDYISFNDTEVRNLVFAFLFYVHDMAMTMISYSEQMFYENVQLIMQPLLGHKEVDEYETYKDNAGVDQQRKKKKKEATITDQKTILQSAEQKKKLREENMAIKQDLDALYAEVFADNDDAKAKYARVKRSNPEQIANLKVS